MTSFILIMLFAVIVISDGILADNNDKDNWLIFTLCYNNNG
jgi:hypothetical protein